MFCSSCGKQLESTSHFCSNCGAPSAPYIYPPRPTPITRSREYRAIGGVCAGLAIYYGWDISVVRIITLVLAFSTGLGFIAYLVAWMVIPEAPLTVPPTSPDSNTERNSTLA
jgi:phage shock protein C